MKNQKIVSIDLDVMKAKATEAAKALGGKAKAQKDKAVALVLDKTISLSQKQVKALEAAKKKLA